MSRRTARGLLCTATKKDDKTGAIKKREIVVPNDTYAIDAHGSVVRNKGQKLTKGQRMQMRERAAARE